MSKISGKLFTIAVTPKVKEKIKYEAEKRNISVSKYIRRICDDNNLLDKGAVRPIADELLETAKNNPYCKGNHTIAKNIEKLGSLMDECDYSDFDTSEKCTEIMSAAITDELSESIKTCLQENVVSKSEYFNKRFLQCGNFVQKTDLVPIIYDLNSSFEKQPQKYIKEIEETRRIWKQL